MILQCPNCRTRYVVPESAIGPAGRSVRCAACRHSWFQDPPEPDEAAPADAPPPAAPPADTADAPAAPEAAEKAAPARFVDDALAETPPAPVIEPDYGPLDDGGAIRPRRNPARRWTIAAIAAGLILLLGVAAIQYLGLDMVRQRLGLGAGDGQVALLIDLEGRPERRTLASGNELFALSGRITNPTRAPQTVPDIKAELQDGQGRIVYRWVITPPARTLAPGAVIRFDAAEYDVPAGVRELKLSFAGSRG